eukprot:g186.t1
MSRKRAREKKPERRFCLITIPFVPKGKEENKSEETSIDVENNSVEDESYERLAKRALEMMGGEQSIIKALTHASGPNRTIVDYATTSASATSSLSLRLSDKNADDDAPTGDSDGNSTRTEYGRGPELRAPVVLHPPDLYLSRIIEPENEKNDNSQVDNRSPTTRRVTILGKVAVTCSFQTMTSEFSCMLSSSKSRSSTSSSSRRPFSIEGHQQQEFYPIFPSTLSLNNFSRSSNFQDANRKMKLALRTKSRAVSKLLKRITIMDCDMLKQCASRPSMYEKMRNPVIRDVFSRHPIYSHSAILTLDSLQKYVTKVDQQNKLWSCAKAVEEMTDLETLVSYEAYWFRSGPWKNLWVRFGVDPRYNPSMYAYQSIAMIFNGVDMQFKYWAGKNTVGRKLDHSALAYIQQCIRHNTSSDNEKQKLNPGKKIKGIFCLHELYRHRIIDEDTWTFVKRMVSASRTKHCDVAYGWFSKVGIKKVREKIKQLLIDLFRVPLTVASAKKKRKRGSLSPTSSSTNVSSSHSAPDPSREEAGKRSEPSERIFSPRNVDSPKSTQRKKKESKKEKEEASHGHYRMSKTFSLEKPKELLLGIRA